MEKKKKSSGFLERIYLVIQAWTYLLSYPWARMQPPSLKLKVFFPLIKPAAR